MSTAQGFNVTVSAQYQVSIEWDGNQPPAKWYRRLAKFGLRVGGDKEISPIERRYSAFRRAGKEVKAVIYQEGMIMTSSRSLASLLAGYAKKLGAVNVNIAKIEVQEQYTQSAKDAKILQKIEGVYGRMGRPLPSKKWAVSCPECLQVGIVEAPQAVSCPNCGGLLVKSRPGEPNIYSDPGGEVFTAWLRTRFSGPHFEPAAIDEAGSEAPALELCHYDDKDGVILLEDAPALELIEKMDRASAFLFLDAIFVNLSNYTWQERTEHRIKAVVSYLNLGGAEAPRLDEGKKPDLLVAAGPLRPDYVAAVLVSLEGDK